MEYSLSNIKNRLDENSNMNLTTEFILIKIFLNIRIKWLIFYIYILIVLTYRNCIWDNLFAFKILKIYQSKNI